MSWKSDAELIALAAALKAEASELLHGAGLLEAVGGGRPVTVVGSYAMDVMTWRDLDVYLELRHERDTAALFAAGAAVERRFEIVRASYSNMFIRDDQEFESGLYWGVQLLHRGLAWKVDLWGYGEREHAEKMAASEELRRTVEGADRLAVLRVKDAACRWEQYRKGVCSVHVYDAVANCGVTTPEGFREWLRRNVPGSGLDADGAGA